MKILYPKLPPKPSTTKGCLISLGTALDNLIWHHLDTYNWPHLINKDADRFDRSLTVPAGMECRRESGGGWLDRGDVSMRGNCDWDIIPEGRVEWIGFSIALVVVLVAAWWISR
jgi:hypothetical protein